MISRHRRNAHGYTSYRTSDAGSRGTDMTRACEGHSCDRCFICTHIGICCMTLSQTERTALLAHENFRALSALEARMAELRGIWGDLSRMKVRPEQIQPTEPYVQPAQPVLPSAATPLALPPGPIPSANNVRKDTIQ